MASDTPDRQSAKTRGDVILEVKNISLSFGGVKALTDISFDVQIRDPFARKIN